MSLRVRAAGPLPASAAIPFRWCPDQVRLDQAKAQLSLREKELETLTAPQDARSADDPGPSKKERDAAKAAITAAEQAVADARTLVDTLEAKLPSAPAYLIRVGTVRERPLYRKRLAQDNALAPPDADFAAALRHVVDTVILAADRPAWHELLARVSDPAAAPHDDAPDIEKARWQEDLNSLADLRALATDHSDRYRRLVAQKEYSNGVWPVIAARMFLVGVENQPEVPFTLDDNGEVSDATLRALGDMVVGIGIQAFALLHLDKVAEKN
ncbi:hypothetical protein [Nitrospirillum bahiense]|uniref:Uncharacterized protein n=1 Tax=Nitrospirillum amazonense TaxID=28077 RepID=A0A560F1V2_9PROT|nr:hypothetical protein [Nitrospirillum amazonense]TWB15596.1 hypothetical protein FBZ88_12949 [Nitrospirillum amazonense]